MRFKAINFFTFLLLAAFLVTSQGSLIGSVWCDSGCLSDIHLDSHTDSYTDNHNTDNHIDLHVVVRVDNHDVNLDQHISGKDDSCLDSPIQLSNGVVKKAEKIKWRSTLDISSTNDKLVAINNIKLVASTPPLKLPPRISQTILAHRTVVLLS